ncbi:hypothetical protein TNCV_1812811 [Trichonephila clavipes]|uniref:Uncharacterized protein n=1 Tax=Trichonephila clavipes TaxID=2585209 RepID=A0A8X7BGP4_TRICX|nr:hypothetical protein TNCV_1812811 [Trichonephila clavipes]
MVQNPSNSVWAFVVAKGRSRTTVHRVLQSEALHSFHVQRVQSLQPDVRAQCVTFAQWFVNQSATDMHFASSVMKQSFHVKHVQYTQRANVGLKQPTKHLTTFCTTMLHC